MGRAWLVGLGGFLGTVARYGLGGFVARLRGGGTFPLETLVINVTGCLVIGGLAGISETRGVFTGTTRAFLFIGVLGGFTTFSAFSNETINLWREGESLLAGINVAAHLVLCLGAVWISRAVAFQIWK